MLRDFVEPGSDARRARGWRGEAAELLLERAPAPRRPGGARGRARARPQEAVTGLRSVHELLEPARRRARDLRPRPGAQHRLLHGRGVRGLRPRARRADRRRRALRRAARALRARAARGRLRARASTACTSRSPARSAAPGAAGWRELGRERALRMSADQRAHDRGAARRAVRRAPSTCSPALGLDTEELRSNDRKLLFEDIGVITMRPSDVPTYVEAGAADLGVTGKDVLLEQAARGSSPRTRGRPRGLRAARPRLRPLHDGARQQAPARTRRSRRCAAWA